MDNKKAEVEIEFSTDVLRRLEALAAREGCTLDELVSRCLREHLQAHAQALSQKEGPA